MEMSSKKSVPAAFAVVAVSVTALITSQVAAAQTASPPGAPVHVVNPLPLPVTVQGGVNGTVSAVQSGSWTVGVDGTVTTANTDEPGRNPFSALHDPFSATASCLGTGGGFQSCSFSGGFPTVPAGMRLVITDFSGQARAPQGCKVASISLATNNEGGGAFSRPHTFAVPHQNPAIAEVADFHERMLAFVEAGSSPTLGIDASCVGISAGVQVATVSGYFVRLP